MGHCGTCQLCFKHCLTFWISFWCMQCFLKIFPLIMLFGKSDFFISFTVASYSSLIKNESLPHSLAMSLLMSYESFHVHSLFTLVLLYFFLGITFSLFFYQTWKHAFPAFCNFGCGISDFLRMEAKKRL